jgi:hypothetical protein
MRKVLAVVALVVVAACSDGDEAQFDGDPSLPDPGGAPAPVDVAAALEAGDGTLVRVAGHLIALPDGSAELCGGPIQESAPPQCGDPALPVDGLDDPGSVPGAAEVGGWVEGDVILTGVVDGGRLDVS